MTRKEVQASLDDMVQRIVARFHPERIILFGSYARGNERVDSDVDLMVVMPVSGSRREVAVEIAMELSDIPLAKDIVVTTAEASVWRKEVTGTIEYPAAQEGSVLCAAS